MADSLLNIADSSIGKILQDFGNEIQKGLIQSLNSSGHNGKSASDTGGLEQSINFSSEIFGTKFTFRLVLADYYDFINQGVNGKEVNRGSDYSFTTKKPPINFSSSDGRSLRQWAERKGISPFAVRESIFKKGIRPNRFYDKVVTEDRLKKLSRDLTKAAADDITVLVGNVANGVFGLSK